MLYEAINAVTQAEAQARAAVAAAEEQAGRLVADAEAAGELALENAAKKAEAKLEELDRQIAERTKAYTLELSQGQEKEKQTLHRRAGYRMERAAALIMERIMEG